MKYLAIISIFALVVSSCIHSTDQQQIENDSTKNQTDLSVNLTNNIKKENKNYDNNLSVFNFPHVDTTLTFTNNLQIIITQTDSVYISEDFLDNKVIDSIKQHYSNHHELALEIEKHLIKKNGNRAKRDSNGLSIKLADGKWNLLTIDKRTDEGDNTFEQFFEKLGYYSIRVQWYEGNGYKLINQENASIIYLIGRPYLSPSGKYIISVNNDLMAGYSDNGFVLYENKNNKIELIGKFYPKDWGPFSVKWVDDTSLVMKCEFLDNNLRSINIFVKLEIKNGS